MKGDKIPQLSHIPSVASFGEADYSNDCLLWRYVTE